MLPAHMPPEFFLLDGPHPVRLLLGMQVELNIRMRLAGGNGTDGS